MESIETSLVKDVLVNADNREWTLQGLGMLRTYISDHDTRLHIWDNHFSVPDVSTLHTHPWNMESHVISGKIVNIRYEAGNQDAAHRSEDRFMSKQILCGPGGGETSAAIPTILQAQPEEVIEAGEDYYQRYDEIHESRPDAGTVSVIKREVPAGGSPDHAYVFYPEGKEWISAEPRPATDEEVAAIVGFALDSWNPESI